jgi:hypothetical protein
VELPDLVALMDAVADSLQYPIDLDETLGLITASAAETIPGIVHASLSVTGKDGTIKTLAPTDQAAIGADQLQYELGDGPCLDAAFEEPVVQVDDLVTDLRWPVYGPKAAAAFGVRSQLAFQFRAEPHARGALNLYSDQPHNFDVEARRLGALFADCAAVALGWSRQDATMAKALEARSTIGTAVGIVMERYGLSPDRAFAFLVRTSQAGNIKLHDVAAGIIGDAGEAE